MTTINDIAKKAGVAKSTVSNVFSKKKYVSPEICERVMKICKELDFQPNFYAVSLSNKQKTNLIGLFLETSESGDYRPFYNELIKSVLVNASSLSYNVVVYYGLDSDSTRNKLVMGRSPIDGAIILSPSLNDERIEAIKEKLIPCVIIGRPDINLPFSTIDVDNVHLVEEVVSEMKESGRNNIYLINSNDQLTISKDRSIGFAKAYNLDEKEIGNHIFYSKFSTKEDGYYYAMHAIKEGADAIITASEIIARGAYEAIKDMNKEIGTDVAVFSLGYSFGEKNNFSPSLTYAIQDYNLFGEKATKMLIDAIENNNEKTNLLLKSRIHYHNSFKKIN